MADELLNAQLEPTDSEIANLQLAAQTGSGSPEWRKLLGNSKFGTFLRLGIEAMLDADKVDTREALELVYATVEEAIAGYEENRVVNPKGLRSFHNSVHTTFKETRIGTIDLVSGNADPQGIAYIEPLNEVWIVDADGRKIFRYSVVGEDLVTGYNLNVASSNAKGITYIADIDEVWVVDKQDQRFYRHRTDGAFIGTSSTGVFYINSPNLNIYSDAITYVPGVEEVWLFDATGVNDKIYRYETDATYIGDVDIASTVSAIEGSTYVSHLDEVWVLGKNRHELTAYQTDSTYITEYDVSDGGVSTDEMTGVTYVESINEVWVINRTNTEISRYGFTDHDHDTDYASITHDHDDDYAEKKHSHDYTERINVHAQDAGTTTGDSVTKSIEPEEGKETFYYLQVMGWTAGREVRVYCTSRKVTETQNTLTFVRPYGTTGAWCYFILVVDDHRAK